jgi:multimeric flavodoxin WrbA
MGKVIAVNGSPRRAWNTATLLKSALDGAESVGAQTRMVHLYDLDFQGCRSCFACKRKGNTRNGLCAVSDDLELVLADILKCDVLLLGSPIYFGDVTGEMRSFLERLLFPNVSYDAFGVSDFPGRVSCGWIFTMNCPEQFIETVHYDALLDNHAGLMKILKGDVEVLASYETWQFDDYSKVNGAMFDVPARAQRREEVFPLDCDKAFQMGARLAGAQGGA